MLIHQLFDLLGSSQDLLIYFEGVTSPAQLVSRLELLKHQDPSELFEDIEALRISTTIALKANIEIGGTLDTGDEREDEVDDLLKGLEGFPADEPENTNATPPETTDTENPDNTPNKPAA
jgi:hypothetical protein